MYILSICRLSKMMAGTIPQSLPRQLPLLGEPFSFCYADSFPRSAIMNEHYRPGEFFGKYIDLKLVLCYSI